ncbi:MAG: 3'-5' exonuclease domain-containing protein 2 [Muribaculaceae bacterium]|nr:3'-5' exonuclease domain-containing protein 2 [Muribaculaceae bacterium]
MKAQNYIISISKEQLAELPVVEYPAEITVVDSAAVAHAALRVLSREKVVGFDTETRPSFHKGRTHKVALMQLSTADRCFLFRLNKIGICAELKAFLENPDCLKIGLSVHDDFTVLRRSGEINPQGFIDLQDMVKHYEISDISLQKIYAIIFGQRISKGQRLTNWEADTLTDAQQAYAALDAWACLNIYSYLRENKFDPKASKYRHLPEPKPEKSSNTIENKK